ncbi:MAG: choice-of-anchor D domain-containing protein, partial [Myxococcota bacterium]
MRGSVLWLVTPVILGLVGCEDAIRLDTLPAADFFDPPEISFGTRSVGQLYESTATLTNSTGRPILVENISFSPPTDAFLPRLADGGTLRGTRVAPGERVDIEVAFAPTEIGDNSTDMLVDFNDQVRVSVRINAEAREVTPARPDPRPSSVAFEQVPVNGRASETIRLFNSGEADGVLSAVQVSPPFSVRTPAGDPLTLPSPILTGGEAIDLVVFYEPTVLQRVDSAVNFLFDTGER